VWRWQVQWCRSVSDLRYRLWRVPSLVWRWQVQWCRSVSDLRYRLWRVPSLVWRWQVQRCRNVSELRYRLWRVPSFVRGRSMQRRRDLSGLCIGLRTVPCLVRRRAMRRGRVQQLPAGLQHLRGSVLSRGELRRIHGHEHAVLRLLRMARRLLGRGFEPSLPVPCWDHALLRHQRPRRPGRLPIGRPPRG
jgi:hypothetical protein